MASAEYDIGQLEELITGDIEIDELVELLPLLKVDVDDFNDETITVDITPDRPDLFSEEGVSRMINSYLFSDYQKIYNVKKGNYEINVSKDNAKYRPFTVAAVIKNLNLDEDKLKTIIRVQEKLHTTLGRKREKVAIGIYPENKIDFPIDFTSLKPSKIKFQPLESDSEMTASEILSKHEAGKKYGYLLDDMKKYPLFLDSSDNVLSMPPIINSEYTGRVSSGKNDLFIECSGFDLKSLNLALNILVTMFYDMKGDVYNVKINYPKGYYSKINSEDAKFSFKRYFKKEKGNLYQNSPDLSFNKIKIDYDLINKLLGYNFSKDQIKNHLKKMCFLIDEDYALIPPYRHDVIHNVDLAEDVSISYGFDNIVTEKLLVPGFGKIDSFQKFKKKINDLMISMNLQPIKNYSIDDIKQQEMFLKDDKSFVKLSNPVNKDYNVMRRSLIPQQFEFLNYNKKKEYPQKFFEIGEVFILENSSPFEHKEVEKMSVVLAGEGSTFTKIKQIINNIANSLDLDFSYEESEKDFLIEGRCASINLDGNNIGFLGEVNPKFILKYDLDVPVVLSEIDINSIYDYLNK